VHVRLFSRMNVVGGGTRGENISHAARLWYAEERIKPQHRRNHESHTISR